MSDSTRHARPHFVLSVIALFGAVLALPPEFDLEGEHPYTAHLDFPDLK